MTTRPAYKPPAWQKGASFIMVFIVLDVLAYGVYLGIQYAPQVIESKSIDSIYRSIEEDHRMDPLTSEHEAKAKVVKMLQVNEMNDMTQNVSVQEFGGKTTIKIKYDREINLLFKKQPMHYEKVLDLN